MIRVSCRKDDCNMIAHYFPPITLEQIQKCPLFHNMPVLEGEHKHDWKIEEITIGK